MAVMPREICSFNPKQRVRGLEKITVGPSLLRRADELTQVFAP